MLDIIVNFYPHGRASFFFFFLLFPQIELIDRVDDIYRNTTWDDEFKGYGVQIHQVCVCVCVLGRFSLKEKTLLPQQAEFEVTQERDDWNYPPASLRTTGVWSCATWAHQIFFHRLGEWMETLFVVLQATLYLTQKICSLIAVARCFQFIFS